MSYHEIPVHVLINISPNECPENLAQPTKKFVHSILSGTCMYIDGRTGGEMCLFWLKEWRHEEKKHLLAP